MYGGSQGDGRGGSPAITRTLTHVRSIAPPALAAYPAVDLSALLFPIPKEVIEAAFLFIGYHIIVGSGSRNFRANVSVVAD